MSKLFYLLIGLLFISVSVSAADMTVHFIDVGQGDAELIQTGTQNILIDAGPKEAGSTVVSYLKSKGVNKLDYVISSHPHEDHIGGMLSVLNNFKVSMYLDNGETTTTKVYKNLMKRLVALKTPYAVVKAGKTFSLGDVKVEVLGPSTLTSDLNADSVVLRVTKGKISYLFPGDAERQGYPSTILKVAHHGSKGSVDLLSTINPKVAVIEVGAGNSYGHPDATTIAKLAMAKVKTYRTDKNWDIVISTNGVTYNVKSMKSAETQNIIQPKNVAPISPVVRVSPLNGGLTPISVPAI